RAQRRVRPAGGRRRRRHRADPPARPVHPPHEPGARHAMIGTADPSSSVATTTDDGTTVERSPVDLGTAASVTTFGTLIWLGPLLGVVAVVYAVVVTCVSIWGEVDTSLWSGIAAGWQRWPVGVSGFLMIAVSSRMFVENGVTRRRLGEAATVSMLVFS